MRLSFQNEPRSNEERTKRFPGTFEYFVELVRENLSVSFGLFLWDQVRKEEGNKDPSPDLTP